MMSRRPRSRQSAIRIIIYTLLTWQATANAKHAKDLMWKPFYKDTLRQQKLWYKKDNSTTTIWNHPYSYLLAELSQKGIRKNSWSGTFDLATSIFRHAAESWISHTNPKPYSFAFHATKQRCIQCPTERDPGKEQPPNSVPFGSTDSAPFTWLHPLGADGT